MRRQTESKKLMAGFPTGAFLAAATCILLISGSASAADPLRIGDDKTFVKLGGLLQGWATLTEDASPDKTVETEFYLRRMRLMVTGQLNEMVNFFVETDSPNFGKGGDLSVNMFIQDAFLELNLHQALQIDIGMILAPFSHNGMQGATSLLPIDYHTSILRYPDGSNKVWRDFGLMLKGLPFGKWVEYRIAIFNGVHGNSKIKTDYPGSTDTDSWSGPTDPRNYQDWPRLTGRLTFNVFDPEGGPGVAGFFYDGIYLAKTDAGVVSTKKVLSIGGSVDWQKDMNITWGALPQGTSTTGADTVRKVKSRDDYTAFAGDIFADIPLDQNKLWSLNGQVNVYYFNYGDRSDGDMWYDTIKDAKSYTGLGIASELGLRYSAIQPIFVFDMFNSTKAATDDTGDYMAVYGGLNYWLFAHSTSIKLQVGGSQANGADDWTLAGALQAQLLF